MDWRKCRPSQLAAAPSALLRASIHCCLRCPMLLQPAHTHTFSRSGCLAVLPKQCQQEEQSRAAGQRRPTIQQSSSATRDATGCWPQTRSTHLPFTMRRKAGLVGGCHSPRLVLQDWACLDSLSAMDRISCTCIALQLSSLQPSTPPHQRNAAPARRLLLVSQHAEGPCNAAGQLCRASSSACVDQLVCAPDW